MGGQEIKGKWQPLLIHELEVLFSEGLVFNPSESSGFYRTPQSIMGSKKNNRKNVLEIEL